MGSSVFTLYYQEYIKTAENTILVSQHTPPYHVERGLGEMELNDQEW